MLATVNATGIKQMLEVDAMARQVRVKRNGYFPDYGAVCANTIIEMTKDDAEAGIANGMLEAVN